MSLPKYLYEPFKLITQCALVQSKEVTDENLKEFEQLLNQAQPTPNTEAVIQQNFLKSMYYSSPNNLIKYIRQPVSHVGALVLWTESRRIVQFFNLQRLVHISWRDNKYHVTKYVEQPYRDPSKNTRRSRLNESKRANPTQDDSTVSDTHAEVNDSKNNNTNPTQDDPTVSDSKNSDTNTTQNNPTVSDTTPKKSSSWADVV